MVAVEFVETSSGRIAIRRSGRGPTIFLLPGTSCSGRSFERQLESPLVERFRLVAIDFPGDGDSPGAENHERSYTLTGYARALIDLANALDAPDAVFVGWSQGGHSLMHAMRSLPHAAGFLLFGAAPVPSLAAYASVMTSDPRLGLAFREAPTAEEVRQMTLLFVRPGSAPPEFFAEDFLRADGRSRAVLGADAATGGFIDETRVLAELTQPLAIIHGKQEQLFVKREWLDTLVMPTLWRNAVQDIADAGHAAQWEAPTLFNDLLAQFADEAFALKRR